jgi:hypothetical protein
VPRALWCRGGSVIFADACRRGTAACGLGALSSGGLIADRAQFLALHQEGEAACPLGASRSPEAERHPGGGEGLVCDRSAARSVFAIIRDESSPPGDRREFSVVASLFLRRRKNRKIQLVPQIVQRLYRPRGLDTWVNETIPKLRGRRPPDRNPIPPIKTAATGGRRSGGRC